MRSLRLALAVSLSALAPLVAQAATLDLTGAAGAAIASGNSSTGSYSGNSAFGTVSFTAHPSGSDLVASSSGLGIDCVGYGAACLIDSVTEIDYPEVLEISFSTPKYLTSVGISQLGVDTYDLAVFTIVVEDKGAVAGDGFFVPFSGYDADANGNLQVAVNQWASSIRFVPSVGLFSDFSVASLTIDEKAVPFSSPGGPSSPIPEPSSVLMMTIGGALVLLSIRRVAV